MPQFDDHGLKGGMWRGHLSGMDSAPGRVVLVHQGEILSEARLIPDAGPAAGVGVGAGAGPAAGRGALAGWRVEVELPARAVSEGLQTLLLIADPGEAPEGVRPGARPLARLPILAGRPLDDDLQTEVAMLRAELDLLKREFRRFAAGVAQGGASPAPSEPD